MLALVLYPLQVQVSLPFTQLLHDAEWRKTQF
jgi:hypothetical protein